MRKSAYSLRSFAAVIWQSSDITPAAFPKYELRKENHGAETGERTKKTKSKRIGGQEFDIPDLTLWLQMNLRQGHSTSPAP
jgi:hypothetical protein